VTFKVKITIAFLLILSLVFLCVLLNNNISAVAKDLKSNLSGGAIVAIYSVADFLSNIEHPQKRIFSIDIKGKVIDAINKKPIENAATIVEYGIGGYDNLKFHKITTTSTSDGMFKISLDKGGYFLLTVNAEGHYPYYSKAKTFFQNSIELYPITAPQNILINIGRVGIKNGKILGYNFQKKNTTFDLSEADIILKQVLPGIKMYKVSAVGEGGFVKVRGMADNQYNFYNTPLAPITGYRKDAILSIHGGVDFYYFRTADGKHYGKMYIGTPGESIDTIDGAFHYIYQPKEKSRNLEITYTK